MCITYNTLSSVVVGPPNINVNHQTNIHDHSVDLIGNVFVYKKHPAVHTVCWTKDGHKIDSLGCGGKYSKVRIDDPSLTIFDVNSNDTGSYQLIATNTIGSTASASIVLSIALFSILHENHYHPIINKCKTQNCSVISFICIAR